MLAGRASDRLRVLPSASHSTRLLPTWAAGYGRAWLRPDVVAGVVVASVVVPQAVAYAQIAGLPPQAGLMAAPGALVGYALLGSSRPLVVSATTSTAAVSAAPVGPLAGGDAARFAMLSAALALVAAVVFAAAGALRLGAVADLISTPVMTGFLFGLGLTIMVGQLPKLLGVDAGEGDFFHQAWDLLGDVHGATLAVGVASVAVLLAGRRFVPRLPVTLLVLAVAIGGSALLDLADDGVAVVGDLPSALPDPALPDVDGGDVANLVGAGLGVVLLSTEGIGVARSLATRYGDRYDVNRDLVALGGANLLAGLSSGFVQAGGASQTAAADGAGGRSQLASIVAAGLVLLAGAFLAPLFEDLPQATLGAIVVVAVASFLRVGELARFARIRRSAIVLSLLALVGVLGLGILQGLVVTTAVSVIYVIRRLSRPDVGALGRDPASGAWGRADRRPGWELPAGVVVARSDGPLLYANAVNVREQLVALAGGRPLVLDMADSADLDVETLDALGELAQVVPELWLAAPHARVEELIRRAGLDARVRIAPTIDAAVAAASPRPGDPRSPREARP